MANLCSVTRSRSARRWTPKRCICSPLVMTPPDCVLLAWIEPADGLLALVSCPGAVQWPFIEGSAPTEPAPCAQGAEGAIRQSVDWLKGLFQRGRHIRVRCWTG